MKLRIQSTAACLKQLLLTSCSLGLSVVLASAIHADADEVFPGADENSPSRAHYFTWINNTNEGPAKGQTEANLDFFQWLKDEYGMTLDIYAFDAGAIDAPNYYGSKDSVKFQEQFPEGFGPFAEQAKGFGGRLGVWLGPDGFGNSDAEKRDRISFLASLCRDDHFALFKMDAVCGQLRTEKQQAFIELMTQCRKYSSDLILLNHRLNLGHATPQATTFLWQGAETYIGVHMVNRKPATHNRAQALSRGLPPELKRLAEDHGVCLSSCLDFWEDDLVLQAFNRSMILAPELYGSPWFLRDDEYPKLARIFNLHRRYRDILIHGMVLPADQYGPHAVSRGDKSTRLITLRNLTWEPVVYDISLDETIGLSGDQEREVRLFHPYEEILGQGLKSTESIKITVYPFRAALILATTQACEEPSISKGPYRVIKQLDGGNPVIEKLTPLPLDHPWHRKLADLQPVKLPVDWEGLYEATCFAADNNALEVRSIERSGATSIPAVKNARDAFFSQELIKTRALWDDFMFDGDTDTAFDIYSNAKDQRIAGGCLRIDFSEAIDFDKLVIKTQANDRSLIRNKYFKAQVSNDLKNWTAIKEVIQHGSTLTIYPNKDAGDERWRYFRMRNTPERVTEVEAWKGVTTLARQDWRASNLFAHPNAKPAVRAWSCSTTINEITPTSYLCVAVEGKHEVEGCYAALRVDKKLVGAPSRASSYPINAWEYPVRSSATGYTYYFPVDESFLGKEIDVVLLGMKDGGRDLKPSVWLTARDLPLKVDHQD